MSNERRPSLAPKDNVDAWKMAQALADARGMIPDSFAGRPSEVFAAILRGNELGFGPMQALSAIAVINGRPAIWGDAVPALVQRHGHTLDHVMAGEGDNRKAVATLKRGDTGHEYVREFSVRDAKAAGLWGRKGPWTQYPDRMLDLVLQRLDLAAQLAVLALHRVHLQGQLARLKRLNRVVLDDALRLDARRLF